MSFLLNTITKWRSVFSNLSISPRARIISIAAIICLVSLHSIFQYSRQPFYPSYQLAESHISTRHTTYSPPSSRPSDAYITFLSSVDDPWFFTSVRLLLFQIKHDPLTRDPSNLDFIVLTTSLIPFEMENQLRDEGAIIRRHDLVDGLPMGYDEDGWFNETNHRYKDQYTKLLIFNMTDWTRLMYLDSDQLLALPIHELWDDPNANPIHGLAAFSDPGIGEHPVPMEDMDYLNAGFMLIKPSRKLFEELLQVTDFDPMMMEQALLNQYFRRDGPFPWLPLNHIFTAVHPRNYDLEGGVHVLHEKLWKNWTWQGEVHRELTEFFRQKLGRMEGYWYGKEQAQRDIERIK